MVYSILTTDTKTVLADRQYKEGLLNSPKEKRRVTGEQ